MTSLLLAVVMLAMMALVTVSAADTSSVPTGAYYNQNLYEGSSDVYNGTDLGATYSKSSTTWKVWSPPATKVQLKLYTTGTDRENGAKVLGTHNLTKGSNNVWSVTLSGDYKNVYYTYLVTAVDKYDHLVTNETQDVYSKAVGANGNRSMVVDLDSTDPEGWDTDKNVCHANKTESAVWELHIRDFSCDPDSGVSEKNQGNYLAFTEGGTTYKKQGSIATCLDYLVENNINTVQLMPFADFDGVDEIYGASEVDRNWGYNPKNFNVPDGSYASNSYDGNVRINEVKQMIQALHDRGIQVVMDVVYNHTAGSDGSSFTKTVPGYYYRLQSKKVNIDGSGQGNEMASDKKMMRNFIVQSLKYWAEEYHIDGFRFDLMGCIDLTTLNQARTTLNGINKNILLYGEPWAGGTTANPSAPSEKNGSSYASGLGAFSGTFRTAASKVDSDKSVTQGWVGGTATSVSTVVSGIKAALMDNNDNTKTVNYLDCHDNLTLWDRLVGAYTKSGEGKSSVTVNTNVNSTDQKYLRQLKLGGVMLYTSQGITFMNSGIEFARTKQGQGNSYNSADQYNKLDWVRAQTYKSSVDYYRGLRQIKEVYTPFNDDTNTSKGTMSFISQSGNLIAYTISNNTANKNNEWGKVAVLMNSGSSAANVNLSGSWTVVANADNASLEGVGTHNGGNYSVPANSAAILVEGTGTNFKNFSNKFNYKTLTINHVLNGSVVKTETAKYRVGTTYHAHKDADLLENNDVVSTEGAPSGTVTDNTTVTYNYASNGKTKAKLTVKYLDQSGKELTPDMVYTLENGDQYSIPVCSIQGYQLDTSKYPAGTTGTFTGAKTITFKYSPLETTSTKVRYYKSSELTGSVQIYAYTDDGKEPLGPWATNPNMTNVGNGWYEYTIPIAACYVMFHGKTGGQEPGQNEPGYLVSGECTVKDNVISYKSTLVTSHINIDTGEKLKADSISSDVKSSTDTYKTSADTSLGELVGTPANAEGFCVAGVTNVVYLYKKAGPTEPSIVDKYLLGDSNCDGKVNVNDVTYIQQGLVNLVILDSTSKRNGDVDGNGRITILDANYIQRYMVGMNIPYKINEEVIIYA